jgi:predicted dehydrogenase
LKEQSVRRLRVAVIGLGMGEQHVLGYLAHPACEVAALCDWSEAKLAAAREKYPGVRLTRRADEVLEDERIQVVSIATYDDAHAGQVVKALDAGKHVFVEKPLCQTAEELTAIRSAWLRHGGRLKLASNLVLRGVPVYGWLKNKIAAGDMGEVYAADGEYLFGRLEKITHGWRKDVDDYSVMAGGGIHLIDLLVWLTGQRPEAVTAAGNRICARGTAFRHDDFVAATLRYPSGMVGRVCANFGCVHRHQHLLRIFGTAATFLYDDMGPRWHWTRDPAAAAAPVTLPTLPAAKSCLIGPFVDAVRGGEDRGAETQGHFDTVSIVLACDQALRTGTSTEVCYA